MRGGPEGGGDPYQGCRRIIHITCRCVIFSCSSSDVSLELDGFFEVSISVDGLSLQEQSGLRDSELFHLQAVASVSRSRDCRMKLQATAARGGVPGMSSLSVNRLFLYVAMPATVCV